MPSSEPWRRAKQLMVASAFAFVSGYTDVVTVVRWKGFGTMMTGNLLFFGRSLAIDDPKVPHDRVFYLMLIVTFALGVVAYRLAERWWPNRGASNLGVLFSLLVLAAEIVVISRVDTTSWDQWCLCGLTPMFGMLTTACSNGKLGAPTNMVTGHIVTLASIGAKACLESRPTRSERHKAALSAAVIFCMFFGAGCGSVAVYFTHARRGLLLPVPLLLAMLLWCYDHLAKPRSLVKKVQRNVRKRRAERRARRRDAEEGVREENDDLSSDEEDEDSNASEISTQAATSSGRSLEEHDDAREAQPAAGRGGAGAEQKVGPRRDAEGADGALDHSAAQDLEAGGGGKIAGAAAPTTVRV